MSKQKTVEPDIVELREVLLTTRPFKKLDAGQMLSCGYIPLNLASSNDHRGFIAPGEYCLIFGDSSSGKTWFYLQLLAEASKNPNFDDYRLIVDNSENGIGMDIGRYFGSKLANRIEPPAYEEDGEPFNSETVEDFYVHIDNAQKKGKPFIYVMDSITSLTSVADDEKFETNNQILLTNREKGTDKALTGSFGMNIAKAHSQNLRRVVAGLRKTGSILVLVAQSRDNVTGYGASKIYAGGRALKFYSHLEIRTSIASRIRKTKDGIDREIGTVAKFQIIKNRHTGECLEVLVPFYTQFGIDSVGGTLDWLIAEKIISKEKGQTSIEIPALDLKGRLETLIEKIEDTGRENELYEFAQQSWNGILESVAVGRKNRYE